MLNPKEIKQFLEHKGLTLIGPVIEDPEQAQAYIVFLQVSVDKRGRRTPSNYKIGQIEGELGSKELGQVNFVLCQSGFEDISASIKSVLLRQFPDEVRNVFSSIYRNQASVWIEAKSPSARERSVEFEQATIMFLDSVGVALKSFTNTSEMALPGQTTCLAVIRRKAPIVVKILGSELRQRGFDYPNRAWLQRKLDLWRRRGLVVRQVSGAYVLTLEGLKSLGSSKNRRSADVVRALDMAHQTKL